MRTPGSAARSASSGVCVSNGTTLELPGVRITYEKGVDNEETPPAADAKLFSPDGKRGETGLTGSYFMSEDASGTPVKTERVTRFVRWISGNVAGPKATGYAAIRWDGMFWPRTSGVHEFSVRGTGTPRVTLDGKTILEKASKTVPDNRDVLGFPVPRRTVQVTLEAGRGYPIRIDYANGGTPYENLSFGVREPKPDFDAAVAAAKAADAAIVIVGSSSTTEGEGYDRANIDLPGEQNRLVEAIAAANPKTAVVVNAGAAMTMPWHDKAPAIVSMWLPGEGGAAALADVLTGKVNPSGKLPVTFPQRTGDDVADLKTSKSVYSEGLLVGYRGYRARGVKPLFPFGHGLSYSSFAYSQLSAPASVSGAKPVTVRVNVRNTAKRAGQEVVQIYVEPVEAAPGEPPRALRAFRKVAIPAGGRQTVALTLDPRAFSIYDTKAGGWRVRPGAYRVLAGASSEDIREVKSLRVDAP